MAPSALDSDALDWASGDASIPVAPAATPVRWLTGADALVYRRAEKIVIAYFVYNAVMVSIRAEPALHRLLAWLVPLAVWTAIGLEARFSRGWSRVVRDWATLGLILVAYRQVDWLGGGHAVAAWQRTWAGWDELLLRGAGLQAAIERFGALLPTSLELAYLLLYSVPAICLGALYWYGKRDQIDRFLTTMFLGTLTAYALLPHFPSVAPRVAFPGQELPHYSSLFRSVNLWLLDHCDIAVSVFPSGHVAVAFSCAFGLLRAIPERRALCALMIAVAAVVYTATVYGRYHYAADGLASIFIALIAWLFCEVIDRNA